MQKTVALASVLSLGLMGGLFFAFDEDKELVFEGELFEAGEQFVTYVETEGVGKIAVQVTLPKEPRHEEGAPVLIPISTFFTEMKSFERDLQRLSEEGFIHVSYIWPGKSTPVGIFSEGEFDYGGEDSILALRDVIAFASGSGVNDEGYTLDQLVDLEIAFENTGLYAFSHPGIAMTNVMAFYGEELPNVSYLVGYENPTDDYFSSVELGYWEKGTRYENPLYSFEDYDPVSIEIDYSSVAYDFALDRAYFDLNGNGRSDGEDYMLGSRIPTLFDKRYYSVELTRALFENGLEANWPEDLATVSDVEAVWPFRTSSENFELLAARSDLKVMMIFSSAQHVQGAPDAPSVHQAYDGFSSANMWIRFNPDFAYVSAFANPGADLSAYEEHEAQTEPEDWSTAAEWGFAAFRGSPQTIGFSGILEMADRVASEDWSADLEEVLY
jgi:hypothetical protein